MKRIAGLIAATGLAAGLLAPGPVAAAPLPHCGGVEVVQLRTFHVVVDTPKEKYAVGQTAIVKVTVTRPAHEDPAGLGVPIDPPVSEPAEDVNVGVGLTIGRVFLPGFARTNADGEATIKIKIEPYVRPGWASADAYAWERQLETPCFTVEENGYRHVEKIFKIVL